MTGPFTDHWLSIPGYRHLGHRGCQENRRGGHRRASPRPTSPLVRPVGSPRHLQLLFPAWFPSQMEHLRWTARAAAGAKCTPGEDPFARAGASSSQPWRLLPPPSGRTHALPPTQCPGTGWDTRPPCTPATAGYRAKPSCPGGRGWGWCSCHRLTVALWPTVGSPVPPRDGPPAQELEAGAPPAAQPPPQ